MSIDESPSLIPDSAEHLLEQAKTLRQSGKPGAARKYYNSYLATAQPSPGWTELSDKDKAYQIQLLELRQSDYLNYPAHVAFETYAQCNAACTFCPYPDLDRQGEKMPLSLIEKIIADLKEIPPHIGFQLSPFGVNEPFLDDRLFDILDLITAQLPNASITLTTNASPLTLAKLKRLASYSLGYLWISVVDHRQAVYEEKMKLPFSRTMDRLKMIHAAKAEGWFKSHVVLSRLMDHTPADEEYIAWLWQEFPLFQPCLWPYANWLGQNDVIPSSDIANIGCTHWFEFRITSSGQVAHCCMDAQARYPWGNVNTHSILEIYNRPNFRRLRERTLSRLNVHPCRNCNLR